MSDTDADPGGCLPAGGAFPRVDDVEGAAVPAGVEVIDAHVHLFPPRVFEAIWRWFDAHAWSVRYRLHAEQVVDFLRARGVRKVVGLAYSHRPGMAQALNEHMADVARAHPEVIPLATVLPGEEGAGDVLRDAYGRLGLRGVKLHCHVQRVAADDPRLDEVYRLSEEARVPVVIHAGREPSIAAYGVDTRALCGADQVGRVLRRFPRLTMVVPHLGADEYDAYASLLARHENLWLDTTMAVGGYLTPGPPPGLFPGMASRLLYGTDFPNVPYAWDRELGHVLREVPEGPARRAVLFDNARKVFSP